MKILLLTVLLTSQAFASDLICRPSVVRAVKSEVVARANKKGSTDKNMHCAVSCLLTLKCRSTEVLILGLGKEVVDAFTPGDADVDDVRADYRGIELAKSGRARDKNECYIQCDTYYQ